MIADHEYTDMTATKLYRPELTAHYRDPYRILLCVIGRTPQIVTETVYALATDPAWDGWIPDEIRVITTSVGRRTMANRLFGDADDGDQTGNGGRPAAAADDNDQFARLLKRIEQPRIEFTPDHIEVVKDDDKRELDDLRTREDNAIMADAIVKRIRKLTSYVNTDLHVSLAGGRKTMGFFAGYALSIFGRQQDRLSHVLVDPPYESHPDFFFPTVESKILERDGSPVMVDGKPADARDATVTLARIPFARLEMLNSVRDLAEGLTYAQLCELLEATPSLIVDCRHWRFVFSGGLHVHFRKPRNKDEPSMPPRAAALYALYAYRAHFGLPGISDRKLANDHDLLDALYHMITGSPSTTPPKKIKSHRSDAVEIIQSLFRQGYLARQYLPRMTEGARFGLRLAPGQIQFVGLPEPLRLAAETGDSSRIDNGND